jgi:RNA polymerase sigma-70 factor, ECF subfamily
MGTAVALSAGTLTVVRTRWHGRTISTPSHDRSPTTLDPTLRAAVVALRPDLLVLARRTCASEADAADVVQDTLESALQAGDRLTAVENLKAWLVTILHRRIIDLFRRREREQLGDPPEEPAVTQEAPPADAPLWSRIDIAQLRAAVERLEPEFREVFVLHAFERRSYRHIAEALGIPSNTVGTRLLRARRKLRVLLVGGPEEVGT